MNIGSEEMVTINQLVEIVSDVANKKVDINHIDGPTGVRGRNSDNDLMREKLNWCPSKSLREGIEKTYAWILNNVEMGLDDVVASAPEEVVTNGLNTYTETAELDAADKYSL